MAFRLLIEATALQSQTSFPLEGKNWTLTPLLDLEDDSQIPPFACISYLWGSDREPHALVPELTMSTRTRPSLATAIRTSSCTAFWTDVFCVPHAGAAHQSTLENMGYIYSRATEVIIVLGENTYAAIAELRKNDFFSESALHMLESDEWVSSVWTYQELVNGGSVYFVSEHQTEKSTAIECQDFFNALGYGLSKWKKSSVGSERDATSKVFPRLEALEDLFVDWRIAPYTYRSALVVFSSLACKRNADPANYFYAILGALTKSSHQLIWNPDHNLAEKVMAICESKNDFSFIYTCEVRDTHLERRWRPRAAPLPTNGATLPAILRPILVMNCWGDAQEGHYDAEGFWLHGMALMRPAPSIERDAKETMSRRLERPELLHADEAALGNIVYAAIRRFGFDGAPTPIIVSGGLIFALETIRRAEIVRLLVSTQIHWPIGAPGLVHIGSDDGKRYVPCAFIGSWKVLDIGESVKL